ncbi:hypothetical protein AUP68_09919 [Ilyonectria robusta]
MDESVCPMQLNFRSKEEMEAQGKSWYTGDVPGFSVFLKKDGEIYHTYSTFARGGDKLMPTLALLDMTPLGRQIGQYGPADHLSQLLVNKTKNIPYCRGIGVVAPAAEKQCKKVVFAVYVDRTHDLQIFSLTLSVSEGGVLHVGYHAKVEQYVRTRHGNQGL